jgi:hypothetical protein
MAPSALPPSPARAVLKKRERRKSKKKEREKKDPARVNKKGGAVKYSKAEVKGQLLTLGV